ncbi:helix-turn-helix domain-containing protein [Microbacterium sp.]|uniref:helix-turn-helix domain-containing protein n=1 Tax=Microbacterium sp. TaxID=51671 RepID=UPI003F9CE259
MGSALESRSGHTEHDIPAGRIDPHAHHHAELLWVRTGMIEITIDGTALRLAAGQAIWVPAGIVHALQLEPDTVTVAVWSHSVAKPPSLSEVRVVDIPDGWGDWLIHKHSHGALAADGPLLELASGLSRHADSQVRTPRLPMPRSPEARAVARALLRTPGSPLSADDFADRESVSAKTLRRQFANETGIVFSEWRTRARVTAAAAHLAEGRGVAWARRHVGYATPAGFTRAFHRHVGIAPREYAHRLRMKAAPTDELARNVAALVADEQASPPPIPAYSGPMRVNDCHVLLWVYRGEASIRIATRDQKLRRGEAIWVPAGVSHRVDLAAGSILRPLGNRYGRIRIGVDDLRVFSFPPEAENYLLHTTFAEYGLLSPDNPLTLTDELFHEQFIRDDTGETTLTGAAGALATALRRDPADSRSLADWAKALGVTPAALGRELTSQTGTSFPHWRAQLRMNIARELLHQGERPGVIARRLGYASPAAFTKVFTSAHGIPPREYQRQATGQTTASERSNGPGGGA